MLHRTFLPSAVASVLLAAGTGLAVAQVSFNPLTAPAGTYAVEPTHTSVTFTIGHLEMSDYAGRFNTMSGELIWDGARLESAKLEIAVDLASVDTPSDRLDEKLVKDFFRTAQFPKATFTSTKVTKKDDRSGLVEGNLTIGTVTKPVTLNVRFNGTRIHPFTNSQMLGFDAHATLKRSDFGLTTVPWSKSIADEVKLVIAAEFLKQ